MYEIPTFIPIEELEDRRVYKIKSRNLLVGVWCAAREDFIGVREKFSSRFLDAEGQWKNDPPTGTANAVEALDVWVPEDIPLRTILELECRHCKAEVTQVWDVYPEDDEHGRGGRKRCVGDRHVNDEVAVACEYDGTHCGQWRGNKALFDLLDPYDQEFEEARRKEYEERYGNQGLQG